MNELTKTKTLVFYILFLFIYPINHLFALPVESKNIPADVRKLPTIACVEIQKINKITKNSLLNIENYTLLEQIEIYKIIGKKYFECEHYNVALLYFLKELDNILQIENNHSQLGEVYNRIGNIYYYLNNTKTAEKYFKKSLLEISKLSKDQLNNENTKIYNNYAAILAMNNYIKESIKYLETYQKFIPANDNQEHSKLYQNLFLNYYTLDSIKKAKQYLYKAKNLVNGKNFFKEEASVYYNLSLVHCKENSVDSANRYLKKMFEISQKNNLSNYLMISSKELSSLHETNNLLDSSLYYLKVHNTVLNDALVRNNYRFLNEQEEIYTLKENEKNLLLKQSRDKYRIIIALTLSLLIISTLLYMINKYDLRIRNIKSNEKKLNEKLYVNEKLIKEKSLQIIKNKAIIDESTKKLDGIKKIAQGQFKSHINMIINDLKSGDKTYNQEEFDLLFKENYSDFYKQLLNKFPNLTKNEIRLCLFAKLNLSIKEISYITKQSTNSITIARYRLKKKLNIADSETSLNNFIIKL